MKITMPGLIYHFFVSPLSSAFFKENPDIPEPNRDRVCGKRGTQVIWDDISEAQAKKIIDHIFGYYEVFAGPGVDDEAHKDARSMKRWLKAQGREVW